MYDPFMVFRPFMEPSRPRRKRIDVKYIESEDWRLEQTPWEDSPEHSNDLEPWEVSPPEPTDDEPLTRGEEADKPF